MAATHTSSLKTLVEQSLAQVNNLYKNPDTTLYDELALALEELSNIVEGTNLRICLVDRMIFDEDRRPTGKTYKIWEVREQQTPSAPERP